MATSIRTRLQASVGNNPPSWVNNGNLGYASTNPSYIIDQLGLSSFNSSSNSYFQVIYDYLVRVERSQVLNGLFGSPLRRGNNKIEIVMSKDMHTSSASGATMIKFVLAVLAAGDKTGRIALPLKTSVEKSFNGKVVIITFNV